ncbi:FHA domain-containing protein [Nocardia uniformis]|uniref:FHA domain-containing protein n=1 Tax=Nocardia uniformis TaxID=53432 RepID=A0A849C019_9NOCA|nr:FHA domain-containing protein [Nocardia uniformis]NNH71934.1 FHA domain-containing protein [Nocardia uniformis]
MDRQVEVVAGSHVLTRIAGAVILVAHRERGVPTADSRAMVAARGLAELVVEASEQAPEGPGRLVARQATRWLMKEADRISPGESVDFGILSAADTGGLAIFLHGAATAVLAGRTVEYYRGSDAAFTVDRVAEHPARAAALYIDDGKGRVPELPERGIGSLVEGVAQAAGAIVWFVGDPVLTWRPRASETAGRHRATTGEQRSVPPPTSAFDPVTDRAEPQFDDPDLTPTRTSTRPPSEPDFAPEPEPRSAPADSPPSRPESLPATGGFDPHHAPTQTEAGTNPAPKPDPNLQSRLDATAKATALTVKVRGFKCARAHPSDPRSAFCSVCGMPVDQTQPLAEVIRPPLGMLVLDDGMTYMLAADAVLGRDPEQSEAARAGLAPLRIDDSSGGMSRAHAEIRLLNWDVTVVDRGSTNGTRVRNPGYRDWIRLQPNQPMTLAPGAEVMLGNRVLRLEPVAPPPFG